MKTCHLKPGIVVNHACIRKRTNIENLFTPPPATHTFEPPPSIKTFFNMLVINRMSMKKKIFVLGLTSSYHIRLYWKYMHTLATLKT